jgi:MFS family permease
MVHPMVMTPLAILIFQKTKLKQVYFIPKYKKRLSITCGNLIHPIHKMGTIWFWFFVIAIIAFIIAILSQWLNGGTSSWAWIVFWVAGIIAVVCIILAAMIYFSEWSAGRNTCCADGSHTNKKVTTVKVKQSPKKVTELKRSRSLTDLLNDCEKTPC